jgi:hypothetical protein
MPIPVPTPSTPSVLPRRINTFKIGADPEFAICDADGRRHQPCMSSLDVGTDHCGLTELRPPPDYTVSGFLENCKKALNNNVLRDFMKPEYTWRGGAWITHDDYGNASIGGHIHIDIPALNHGSTQSPEVTQVIAVCDHVTEFLEDLRIYPQAECHRRRQGNYGHFGQVHYDKKSPEGHNRIEYRTPPSWLFSYKVAFLSLTLYKLAIVSPILAKQTLVGRTNDERWKNLRKFLRMFAHLDSDAMTVVKTIARSKFDLPKLQMSPDRDFKADWGVSSDVPTPRPTAI